MNPCEVLRASGLAAVATSLAACLAPDGENQAASGRRLHWKMLTLWPKDFPGLGTGKSAFGARISAAPVGLLTVKVYGAGGMVPAFEVFDAVSRGVAEMGHSAAYFWRGKTAAFIVFPKAPLKRNIIYG